MVRMELNVRLPVIGVARTSYRELETTPIQAGLNRAGRGTVEIAEPYRDGLDGLAGFDYAWLLSWLHQPRDPAGGAPLRQVPFLLRRQRRPMGIFATRGPLRVNPIVTIVSVLAGASLLGILGALLAIPTAAAIQIVLRKWWRNRGDPAAAETG